MDKSTLYPEELDAEIEKKTEEMLENQKLGDYLAADACMRALEQLKKDSGSSRLHQLKVRQRSQKKELNTLQKQEMEEFTLKWKEKQARTKEEGQKNQQQMIERHGEQYEATREQLQKSLPTKLKESSELLNLRKVEEHMAKQRNYLEAHKVQEECREMEKEEKIAWINARSAKIESALKKLKHKQDQELKALVLRNTIAIDEIEKNWAKQDASLRLKFENSQKEQKLQHEKEVLSHKGQFKTKAGLSFSSSMSKSKTTLK